MRVLRVLVAPRSGQALLMVVVMLPLFLSVIGLAIDGGILLDRKRELQNNADAAARAGAGQVDTLTLRASDGRRVVLDRAKARAAASRYLSRRGTRGSVATDLVRVRVVATERVQLVFLPIVGLRSVEARAEADARVRYGIDRPVGP